MWPARPGQMRSMPTELYVVLWSDEDGPQCALYEDLLEASRDAELVDGRVEVRSVHLAPVAREGRFAR